MPNWKAITFDYAALLDYDDTTVINVCLTQRKVAVLKALLITAYWRTRWENLTVPYDNLESWVSQIDFLLDGNDCSGGGDVTIFRENPIDQCDVQYSNDDGLNWFTMFRKDNCQPNNILPSSYDDLQTSSTTIITNQTNYAGNIQNVTNNYTWDANIPGDGASTDALL